MKTMIKKVPVSSHDRKKPKSGGFTRVKRFIRKIITDDPNEDYVIFNSRPLGERLLEYKKDSDVQRRKNRYMKFNQQIAQNRENIQNKQDLIMLEQQKDADKEFKRNRYNRNIQVATDIRNGWEIVYDENMNPVKAINKETGEEKHYEIGVPEGSNRFKPKENIDINEKSAIEEELRYDAYENQESPRIETPSVPNFFGIDRPKVGMQNERARNSVSTKLSKNKMGKKVPEGSSGGKQHSKYYPNLSAMELAVNDYVIPNRGNLNILNIDTCNDRSVVNLVLDNGIGYNLLYSSYYSTTTKNGEARGNFIEKVKLVDKNRNIYRTVSRKKIGKEKFREINTHRKRFSNLVTMETYLYG